MLDTKQLQKQADTIRFLCADMVQEANSGHPGVALGLSDIITTLSHHIKHNPKNSKWLNRDRLVFSGGHASTLLYSYLYLTGYDLTLEDLKNFRQLGSKTAGHPEYGEIDGIEITTGPLGQGVANAVGFSMASKYAQFALNTPTTKIIDHKVYCLCGDGDLQEGISYEACSIAGLQNLNNLILIYDSNEITIEGNTELSINENIKDRFEAQGWEVSIIDGHNFNEIDTVLTKAKSQTKPYLIIAKTVIAKGADKMEGSHHSHGAPLGEEEIAIAKRKAGFDPTKKFFVDEDVLFQFRTAIDRGDMYQREWKKLLISAPFKEQNQVLEALQNPDFSKIEWPKYEDGKGKAVATRSSNGEILNAIAKAIPSFIGGSADLSPSNKSELKNMGIFPKGRNIYFGIREHSMGAISNAISLYGLFLPFNATFFVFSDYLKPAVRVASIMKTKQFYIWTHDSIGVGEDGGTHQPIEQLSQFRAMPNFYVFRPADATENVKCWQKALTLNYPSGFVLSRQNLKTLKDKREFGDVENGAYLLTKRKNATVTIMASGSELMPSLMAACHLEIAGINANIVSIPCFDLFNEQSDDYKSKVLDKNTKILAVEASSGMELYKYADEVLSMTTFGASGKAEDLFKKYGITIKGIKQKVFEMLKMEYKTTNINGCDL